MLLLLKLILSPSLVAMVTLAGRRWGHRASGLLTGLPVSTGPILLFFALEQGTSFAAHAAAASLAGIAASAAYFLAFAWTATRAGWLASLAAGTAASAILTALLNLLPLTAGPGLVLALASIAIAHRLMPPAGAEAATATPASAWDMPLRIAATIGMVLALTGAAHILGPALSGLLTPFPVATSVIASFTLAQHGSAAAIAFLRALTGVMYGFCLFGYTLAVTFEPLGTLLAFVAALAVQLAASAAILYASSRPWRAAPPTQENKA